MEIIITFNNVKKTVLVVDKPLASGGEGAVHRFVSPELGAYCVKVYHHHCRTKDREQKLAFMVKHKPENADGDGFRLCWPLSVAANASGEFVGFVMPLAYPDSIQLYDICHLRMSNKYAGEGWANRFDRSQPRGNSNRAKICINLAGAVNAIHSNGNYVLVDFKPQNVLITNKGQISITDLDSIQIAFKQQLLFPAKVATPEYAPKEGRSYQMNKQLVPETWDRFSLAVVLYEILLGIHPYTATVKDTSVKATTIDESISSDLFVHGPRRAALAFVPQPHTSFTQLPPSIQMLFQRAFGTDAAQRPSTVEWGSTLFAAYSQKLFEFSMTGLPPKQVTQTKTVQTRVQPPTGTMSASTTKKNKSSGYIALLVGVGVVIFLYILANGKSSYRTTETTITSPDYSSSMSADSTSTMSMDSSASSMDTTMAVPEETVPATSILPGSSDPTTGRVTFWSKATGPIDLVLDYKSEADHGAVAAIENRSNYAVTECGQGGVYIYNLTPGYHSVFAKSRSTGAEWKFQVHITAGSCALEELSPGPADEAMSLDSAQ